MKKISLFIMALMLLGFASASVIQNLGTFKQNECITLSQTCGNCSYVNLTSIVLPNSNVLSLREGMTQQGTTYNYSFCDTVQIGSYIANTEGDGIPSPYSFEITPSGYKNLLGFYVLLIVIIAGLLIFGFAKEDRWIVNLGGMALLFFGFLIITQGIDFIKNTTTTWAIGLIIWGAAIYVLLKANMDLLGEFG